MWFYPSEKQFKLLLNVKTVKYDYSIQNVLKQNKTKLFFLTKENA